MGIIISRFRKKKPTLDVLNDLDKRIRDMEAQSANSVQRFQRVSKGLVLYTVGLYVISTVMWYWYWPPLNVRQQLYRAPVLVFIPVLIFILRLIVKFYFTRKIRRNDGRLIEMRAKKKQILEEVMDRETYKVARTILERFAPESLGVKSNYLSSVGTPQQMLKKPEALSTSSVNHDIRRRTVPALMGQAPTTQLPSTRASSNSPEVRPTMTVAKPVLPHERTFLDRFLEFIIGDGPSNRFALICKSCMCHNGMALKEEFEYLQFRCYNCQQWNPARKQRPQAPRLEESQSRHPSVVSVGAPLLPNINSEGDSSSSESDDDPVQVSRATENSKNEDSNNETAEINEKDNLKTEDASLEHDSSVCKETGGNVDSSDSTETVGNLDSSDSTETGGDLETSHEGEKLEESSVRKCTESNSSDKDEAGK